MSTQTNIAWYYVGVMALLLVGQNYVLNNAHKEQMAKLAARIAPAVPAPVVAAAAPPAPAPAPAAAEPSRQVVAAPVSTLNPTPVLKASAAPAASSGKTLPVEFGFRSEPFEKSKIVTLTNKSAKKLDCMVKVDRPSTGESKAFKVAVAASGEARLVGSEHGWKFKTGDLIEVAQAGFKSRTTSVP